MKTAVPTSTTPRTQDPHFTPLLPEHFVQARQVYSFVHSPVTAAAILRVTSPAANAQGGLSFFAVDLGLVLHTGRGPASVRHGAPHCLKSKLTRKGFYFPTLYRESLVCGYINVCGLFHNADKQRSPIQLFTPDSDKDLWAFGTGTYRELI